MKLSIVIILSLLVVWKILQIVSIWARNKAQKDLHNWIDKGM